MATTTNHSVSFFDHFDALEDPRITRCQRHHLRDIIFIAVCALISNANDIVGIEKFGHERKDWLAKYLELPNGIPSHDTFGRVLALIDPDQFVQCFMSWVRSIHELTIGEVVAIDGKTARGSIDRAKGRHPLHVVTAWASANRVALGQVAVAEKTNEITAIPDLLDMLELRGAIVTVDAMGCQKEIAAKVRERGADYVLAVKGNQPHLEEDIVRYFAALDEGTQPPGRRSVFETHEKGHGRIESRYYEMVPVPKSLRGRRDWKDLRSIGRATRVWSERGDEKSEVRYIISSARPNAEVLGQALREHWGIENGLHWVLDMYFGEDRSRVRRDHAPANLAVLRRWMLTLLRNDTTLEGSIDKKRLQAAWNESKLEQVLGLP